MFTSTDEFIQENYLQFDSVQSTVILYTDEKYTLIVNKRSELVTGGWLFLDESET